MTLENKLEKLKGYLKYYNNKKMPDSIQKEITENWNPLRLWIYVNYWPTEVSLKYDIIWKR